MTINRLRFARAISLMELIVATLVLGILIVGALNDQYYAAMHTRIARSQTAAAQTARLLLEDWVSTGGSDSYAPTALMMGFSSPLIIPNGWDTGHGEGLGAPLNNTVYSITVDDLPMIVMLRLQDVEEDVAAQVKLRQLTVIVGFGEVHNDGSVTFSDKFQENIPEVIISTYTRIDAG
ncbi:MAG: hypothetical protein JW947_03885 [Sedimentisphaerales bacterium]|nr:hypothetical protein [Sedimentisphaerales bacterium]